MSREEYQAQRRARSQPNDRLRPTRRTLLFSAGAALVGTVTFGPFIGCDSRPKAPALRDSSVYQNRAAQLRFLVPQGWTQVASSDLPPGPLATEVMVAKYQMKTSARGAMLELLCMDSSDSLNVGQYHAQPSHGISGWKDEADATELTISGSNGQRFFLHGVAGKNTMHKEVSAFRRGTHVISFVGLYWDDDHEAREEIRRAVASVVWLK